MKICIVRLSALGDVVMMVPLIRTLQKKYPAAKISWVISHQLMPLIKGLEGIELIPVEKMGTLTDFLKMKKLFKGREFDVLLATQASLSANLFYPLIKAKRKIGFDRSRSNDLHGLFINERITYEKEHIVDSFYKFAKHLGALDLSFDKKLPLFADDFTEIENLGIGGEYIVIHPCSSRKERNWPENRLIEIGEYLQKNSPYTLVLTGAKDEIALCERIALGRGINLAGKTSLRGLAALLSRAKFVIAPDTGVVHIANSFDVPVIGLYSSNSSDLGGPYKKNEYVIDKYEEALQKFKGIKKSESPLHIRIHDPRVMDLITVEDVVKQINKLLEV